PIGKRLEHDGAVIIVPLFEFIEFLLDSDAGRHGKSADVVVHAGAAGRDKVRERQVRPAGGFHVLLTQVVPGHQHFAPALVGVYLDILTVDRGRRQQSEYSGCGKPPAFDDFFQYRLSFGEDLPGLAADDGVLEYRRIGPGQLPGLEERTPIDVAL